MEEIERRWKRELQYAAVGVVTAALIELFATQLEGARERRRPSLAKLLLAGGVAAAYAHLVPRQSWGLRSGAAFAQLPAVASVHSSLGGGSPLQLGVWGALTGLAMQWLQPQRMA